jgi:hypothetical protein
MSTPMHLISWSDSKRALRLSPSFPANYSGLPVAIIDINESIRRNLSIYFVRDMNALFRNTANQM